MNITLRRFWHRIRRHHPWRFVPGYEQHGTVTPAMLLCDTCEIGKPIDVPHGSNESLTAELDEAQEALLAQIDAAEWPKDADTLRCRDVLERVFPLDYLRFGEA